MPKVSPFWVSFFVVSLSTNAWLYQPTHVPRWKTPSSLEASYNPYSSGDKSKRDNHKSRTDLRQLLTQRSIQSFVFLLNQCKEGPSIRWLEKQLHFKEIDSFHGTGAFNATLFPEWDTFFLQLAVQDLETVIIQVEAQKKSHRGWAHQGNYLDGISSGFDPAAPAGTDEESSNSPAASTPRRKGAPGNTLANSNSASPPQDSSQPSAVPKWKPKWKPVSRSSGVASNYLESLNQPRQETGSNQQDSMKSKKSDESSADAKDQLKMNKDEGSHNGKSVAKMPKTSHTRGGSYLDGLSSNTLESSNYDEAPAQSNGVIENPHIEAKTVEFEFIVDPGSLLTRILSVREQISKEWKDDLATLVRTNERILDEYEEHQRVAEAAAAAEDEAEEEEDGDDSEGALEYLNDMKSPYGASQEDGTTVLYDRNAMAYLTNSIATQGQAASPFRRSNFDLLVLLCTQESIHRVLNAYKDDTDDEMHMEKYIMLNSFYKMNVESYFDGHEHSFGRGDQFLEAFLKVPPVARTTQKGNLSLIDPVAIMEDLLRERSAVARHWKSIVNTIPDEHLDLRRILFNRHLMESSNWNSADYGNAGVPAKEAASSEAVTEPGAFE